MTQLVGVPKNQMYKDCVKNITNRQLVISFKHKTEHYPQKLQISSATESWITCTGLESVVEEMRSAG